jgi:tRNA nucleotidyltransferase/poly(A) polymerase
MLKISSKDPEQEKAYALLAFLTTLSEAQSGFAGPDGLTVHPSDHIYVVGGAVRNFLLKKPVKDIDIVIDAVALSTDGIRRDAEWLADMIVANSPADARIEKSDPNNFGVELLNVKGDWIVNGVNLRGEDIEIAFARTETYKDGGFKPDHVEKATIEEDSLRREFTVNTLLWRFSDLADKGPSEEIIIDPLGIGLRDLKNNILDTPMDPEQTFKDDSTRMMRVMKFQFKYGFDVAPRVTEALKANPEYIRNAERNVLADLLKHTILNQDSYIEALNEMKENLILGEVIKLLNEEEVFRTSIMNWVHSKKDLNFLFVLLDYGFPIGDKISFLSEDEKRTFRENIKNLSKVDQYEYLRGIKSPGNLIKDRGFFMAFYNSVKELNPDLSIANFNANYYQPVAKEIILYTPEIAFTPEALKERVRDAVMTKLNMLAPTEGGFINVRLNKLAKYLENIKEEKCANSTRLLKTSGSKYEERLSAMVPQASGDVFIFDFDDTLFWTPEWFNEVSLDENNAAVGVTSTYPMIFGKAISFVNKLNSSPELYVRKTKKGEVIPELIEKARTFLPLSLRKKIVDIPALGKKNQVVFVLTTGSGGEMSVVDYKELFSSKHQRIFDTRGKYYPNAVIVSGDPNFYKVPETLGTVPNDEIVAVYKEYASNSYVLTARETALGMAEGVVNRLESVGLPAPLKVFTRPGGMSGSEYKGYVIGEFARQPNVTSITFYDDNKRYISGVRKILEERYPAFAEKVTLNHVSIEAKP